MSLSAVCHKIRGDLVKLVYRSVTPRGRIIWVKCLYLKLRVSSL